MKNTLESFLFFYFEKHNILNSDNNFFLKNTEMMFFVFSKTILKTILKNRNKTHS